MWYLYIVLPLHNNTITNLIKCVRRKYIVKWDVKTDVFFSSEENEGITLSDFGLQWHALYLCFSMKSLIVPLLRLQGYSLLNSISWYFGITLKDEHFSEKTKSRRRKDGRRDKILDGHKHSEKKTRWWSLCSSESCCSRLSRSYLYIWSSKGSFWDEFCSQPLGFVSWHTDQKIIMAYGKMVLKICGDSSSRNSQLRKLRGSHDASGSQWRSVCL